MKATGIVRRIDDLGRVVIPKEIRRTMHIREGEAMEIYTGEDGEVVFRKYSPLGENAELSLKMCDALWKTANKTAAVCDRDRIVAVSGPYRKELMGRGISRELDEAVSDRRQIGSVPGKEISVSPDMRRPFVLAETPIICDGDVTGCVLLAGDEPLKENGETEMKLCMTAAGFLGRSMQN